MDSLPELIAFLQIILIDIAMSGDNAVAVGMAAAGLPAEQRHRAVLSGIVAATALRVMFAIFAVQLLDVTGLLAAGGLLLMWVAWKMYGEIRHHHLSQPHAEAEASATPVRPPKKFSGAILQIVIADVSMSLDNVLAVAGVARDHIWVLVMGLTLSVAFMGLAAAVVARLTSRHAWIAYAGLAVVAYTALKMMWDGGSDLLELGLF